MIIIDVHQKMNHLTLFKDTKALGFKAVYGALNILVTRWGWAPSSWLNFLKRLLQLKPK